MFLPTSLALFWAGAPSGVIQSHLGEGWASLLSINYITHMPLITHALTTKVKLLGFCISIIPLSINLLILFYLIKLFKSYVHESIFSRQNVSCIQRIGWLLLAGQLLAPIYEALISATLTWGNPVGHRLITISFSKDNLAVILCATMIIVIAWIMAEAYKDQENHKLII